MSKPEDWIYLKLYLSAQAERADALLADLGGRMAANDHLVRWFYLRYMDEQGFHIRLRALPRPEQRSAALQRVNDDCTAVLERIYDYVPGTYEPMVRLPDYLAVEVPVPTMRIHFTAESYVPEHEKFGTGAGMDVAEGVFHLSSDLARRVLEQEAKGVYSRKSLAPLLMHAANAAFPSVESQDYWRQYSLYWLGGESPAAQDWRERFLRKADALKSSGIELLNDDELPEEGKAILRSWRDGLEAAAGAYARLPDHEQGRSDVLSLNFSHLMLNRLGIATLEESYLATLLESREQVAA